MINEDRELIERSVAGDTDAFGRLVSGYQNRLHASLCRLVGPVNAADLCQETFLLAYRKLGSFRGESAFYSWLFRIAFNVAASFRRKRRARHVGLIGSRDVGEYEPANQKTDNAPEHALEVEEQRAQVRKALNELPDEFRDPVVLREIEGLSYEEIAELLDCPVGTVRSRIHRGRTLLRERLRQILGDDAE